MAEHIDNLDLLGSGGHVWVWSEPAITRKSVGSVAIWGEYQQVTAVGARAGRIGGRDGGPAILKASAPTKAAADAAMNAIEAEIEYLVTGGYEVTWEDDQSHSGIALVLTAYRRVGSRQYSYNGATERVWQGYRLDIAEMDGGFW